MKSKRFDSFDTIIPALQRLESDDLRSLFTKPSNARIGFQKDGLMPFSDFLNRNVNKPRVSRTKMTSV